MKTIKLGARIRKEYGKEYARKLRAKGLVPAIFYGYKVEPVMLEVDSSKLIKILEEEKNESAFVNLEIEGENSKTEKLSIIKDLQINTSCKSLIHADFYEIRMDRELTMDLPILLVGQPIGVELGGLLQQLKRDLKVSGLPSVLPESVELDVSGLDIGASVNVGDIVLGDGINILDGKDVAVASLISKRVAIMEEEAAEEGGAIEGEAAAGGEAEVSEGQGE